MSIVARFLEVFTRPFANDRETVLQIEGRWRQGLEAMAPEEVQRLTGRLERPRRPGLRKWMFRAGLLAALAAFVWEGYTIKMGPSRALVWSGGMSQNYPYLVPVAMVPSSDFFVDMEDLPKHSEKRWKHRLTSAVHQELFGGTTSDRIERTQNGAEYLYELRRFRSSRALLREHLSAEALTKRGDELDPDNAWFPLLAAAQKAGSTRGGMVSNAAEAAESMALIHLAATKPTCDSYSAEWLQKTIEAIPAPQTALDQFLRLCMLSGSRDGVIYRIQGVIQWQAGELERARDLPGLVQLVSDWKRVSRHLSATVLTPVDGKQAFDLVHEGGGALVKTAKAMGASELEKEVQRILDTEELRSLQSSEARREWVFYHSSNLSSYIGSIEGMQNVPEADFIAQLKMNQGIADRAMAWAGMGAVFIAMGILSLGMLVHPAESRRASTQVSLFLNARDYAWILGMGIGLPLALYVGVSHFSPLGCRDRSVLVRDGFPLLVQAGSAVLMSIAMLLEMSRWRVARRLAFAADGNPGFGAWQLLVPVLCLLAFLASGIERYINPPEGLFDPWFYSRGRPYLYLLGIPAAVLVARMVSIIRSSDGSGLVSLGALRVGRSGLMVLLVSLLATIPFSIQKERHWVTHDPLFTSNPEHYGYGRAAREGVADLRQRLLRALDTK